MDHSEAASSHAAEQYLLGELSPEQRDAFEEHFFECASCAEEVQTGAVFADNARAVFAETAPRKVSETARETLLDRFRAFWKPVFLIPAAACAALLSLVAYQDLVVIAGYRKMVDAPQAIVSFPLLIARGGESIPLASTERSFALTFDLPVVARKESYRGVVRAASGKMLATVIMRTPPAGHHFDLVLPVSQFPSGSYDLIVQDNSGTVAQYRFRVNRE